jgi:large subunit ribosomal protein L22
MSGVNAETGATMEARAITKFVRTSPTKMRRVINLLRGKPIDEAMAIVDFTRSMSAEAVKKTLVSAAANAENNMAMRREELFVKACYVDSGPVLKRMQPGSMGRGAMIRKRTSHVTIVVADREEE